MYLMKKYNVRMPLFYVLGQIIEGKVKATDALKQIMSTQPTDESL